MLRSIAVAAALVGCSKGAEAPPPTCAQIAERMHELALKEYPGRAELGSPKSYIEGCEARAFTAVERRCMIKARSMKALAKCRASDDKPAAP